jgi:predicted NBD/HSP70 family sugar kinase
MHESGFLDVPPIPAPGLDPAFRPLAPRLRRYREALGASGRSEPFVLALERDRGNLERLDLEIFPAGAPEARDTFPYLAARVDLFLHGQGGWRLFLGGDPDLCGRLAALYQPGGPMEAVADRLGSAYRRYFEIRILEPPEIPEPRALFPVLGGQRAGRRIGFLLGARSIRAAAVVDGRAVHRVECPWNPAGMSDPADLETAIRQCLALAAAPLGEVDAVGGGLPGLVVDNEVRVSSLFRGPRESKWAGTLFRRLEAEWGVPVRIVGDGDVAALAQGLPALGAVELLGDDGVMGYLDPDGRLTGRMNLLAPMTMEVGPSARPLAAFLGREAFPRLAEAAGIHFPSSASQAENLGEAEARADRGEAGAREILETLGTWLGHAAALVAESCELSHLLIRGEGLEGAAGDRILARAGEVFPGGPAPSRAEADPCVEAAGLPMARTLVHHDLRVSADPVERLVAALPELYQPILDHPGLSRHSSRPCEDRLPLLSRVASALAAKAGRPLRVLDLGCAQGYFSFHLAMSGARVEGIDVRDSNVALCRLLADAHPELDVRFRICSVQEALDGLEPDQVDLVLGLSVLHYDVHAKGAEAMARLLATVARRTVAGLFEMALDSEGMYWSASQPRDPASLLVGYRSTQEIARHPAWLPGILRPLYFASDRFRYADGVLEELP